VGSFTSFRRERVSHRALRVNRAAKPRCGSGDCVARSFQRFCFLLFVRSDGPRSAGVPPAAFGVPPNVRRVGRDARPRTRGRVRSPNQSRTRVSSIYASGLASNGIYDELHRWPTGRSAILAVMERAASSICPPRRYRSSRGSRGTISRATNSRTSRAAFQQSKSSNDRIGEVIGGSINNL